MAILLQVGPFDNWLYEVKIFWMSPGDVLVPRDEGLWQCERAGPSNYTTAAADWAFAAEGGCGMSHG
jgi:hypothetical protein